MEIICSLLLMAASIVTLISSIGLIRFPDIYTKMGSVSLSATLGIFLILITVSIYQSMIFLLGLAFYFLSSPVISHLMGLMAYRYKVPISQITRRQDLEQESTRL